MKTSQLKKNFIFIAIAVLAVIALIFMQISSHQTFTTQTVQYGVCEDKVNTDGYLMRSEYLISAPETGLLNCIAKENQRVERGSTIASIYVGEVDENTQERLKSINERIAQLTENKVDSAVYAGDKAMIDSAILGRINSVIEASYNNNTESVIIYKDEINRLIESTTNQDSSKSLANDTLWSLKQEKSDIENKISTSIININAPIAGAFSSSIDGYEQYLDPMKMDLITPSYINNAKANKFNVYDEAVKDHTVVKLFNNYKYYFVANVSADWASSFKVGNPLSIRFPGISDNAIDGVVEYISKVSGGKVALVVGCSTYLDGIYNMRDVSADIIKSSYSGFKISKEAVRVMKDGTCGVYVNKDGVARFRTIDVSYSGDDYVIARENNNAVNNILLYDEVITNSNNLKDGKIIN